jgi:hypothetical protein
MNRILFSAPIIASLAFTTASQGQVTEEQAKLVDEGRRVFNEETFDGNGRTCSTCHIDTEGYNIFPSSIARLPKKERDLVFAVNVPGFENVELIESRALFNISGGAAPLCPGSDPSCFDDEDGHSGPIFRGSMAIQALELTTAVAEEAVTDDDFNGTTLLPEECSEGVELELPQLGWSGDGSPGTPKVLDGDDACQTHHGHFDMDADGSIRAFATGAIAQHFTKSLYREPGVDFRRATKDELNALEAFQRWLGRRPLTTAENAAQGTENASEFDILKLDFQDPRVALGRDHFANQEGATCFRCHTNGSALGDGDFGSNNTITSVGLAGDDIGVAAVGFPLPDDEGTIVTSFAGRRNPDPFFGGFNTQSIIEAAEKKSWFHNNKTVGDFEEAIGHYGTDDFLIGDTDPLKNPNGRPIPSVKPGGFPPRLPDRSSPGLFTPERSLAALQFGRKLDPQSGEVVPPDTFPAGDGVEHLGAFLRALNAFYHLRDCERLIDEAIDRIELHVSADNPIEHCMFNLTDVKRVLKKSKVPGLHKDVQKEAKKAHAKLMQAQVKLKVAQKAAEKAQGKNNAAKKNQNTEARLLEIKDSVLEVKASVVAIRNSIATQVTPL